MVLEEEQICIYKRKNPFEKISDETISKKRQEESPCRFGFLRSFLRLRYCSIFAVAHR